MQGLKESAKVILLANGAGGLRHLDKTKMSAMDGRLACTITDYVERKWNLLQWISEGHDA